MMIEQQIWTQEEDQVLKYLRQDECMIKWNFIARKMSQEYNFPERTGKECKQRYQNHIIEGLLSHTWSPQQELQLYCLHDQIGNKWSIISQKMPGRNDNTIKNHFYAKLRRSVRKLNRYIQNSLKKQYREISLAMLSKIVEGAQERLNIQQKNQITSLDLEMSNKCNRLKNQLLAYVDDEEETIQEEKIREIISQIHTASKKFRKKPKNKRKGSCQQIDVQSAPKFQQTSFLSQCGSSSENCSDFGSFHESLKDIKPLTGVQDYELSCELQDKVLYLTPIIEQSSNYSSQIQRRSNQKGSFPSVISSQERKSSEFHRTSGFFNRLDMNMLPITKKSSSFCSKNNSFSNRTEKSSKQNTYIQNQAMLDESMEKVNENSQKIFSNIGEVQVVDQNDILFFN